MIKKAGAARLLTDAKKMLEFMERLTNTTPEVGTDREVSAADVVNELNPMWVEMRRLTKRMRQRPWAT